MRKNSTANIITPDFVQETDVVTTVILPGLPGVTGKVDPVVTAFINDAVYATFYSTETGITGSGALTGNALMNTSISPADIEAVFLSNITGLLNSSPYKGSVITGATLELVSEVQNRKGISLSWLIKVSAGRTVIRADIEGSVIYSIRNI